MSAQITDFINSLATSQMIFILTVINLAIVTGLALERISAGVSKIRIVKKTPPAQAIPAQAPPPPVKVCPECGQANGQHLALCTLAPKSPGSKKARAPCPLCGSTGSNHFKNCPKRQIEASA